MLLMERVSTKVEGTGYTLEYAITQKGEGEEEKPGGPVEYGIRCSLYELEAAVASEEVKGITSEWDIIKKFFHILEKNQVFPAHLREIIEDLVVLEYEEERLQVIT